MGASDLSGNGSTCALIPGGNIECWGSAFNYNYLVGYNTPYTISGRNAVAIARSGGDLCWLDNVGSVSCLRTNNGNVLATAPVNSAPLPTTTSVTFGTGPFVYTGSAFTATASVSPADAGAATIAYSGDCTNAGNTCTATATYAGDATHTGSSATASITIAQAPTTTSVTFGPGPYVYTGSAFTATASVSPAAAGTATISYSGDCTFAGNTCQATANYAGNGNFLSSSASTNIVIKYPVATSTGQCKNGGWHFVTDDLGNLFKNQGDCVSYVATKGKNKGAGAP